MNRRRMYSTLLLLVLAYALLPTAAGADMAGDPAIVYEVNYKVEGESGIIAHLADYTYAASSGQLAKNANVYQEPDAASTKKGSVKAGSWLVVLDPYQTVPLHYYSGGQIPGVA